MSFLQMWFRYINLGLALSCWRWDVALSSVDDLTRKVWIRIRCSWIYGRILTELYTVKIRWFNFILVPQCVRILTDLRMDVVFF